VSSPSIGDVAEDGYTADFDEDGIFPEPIYKHVEDPYYHTVYQAQFTKVNTYYIVRPILKIIEKYYYQLWPCLVRQGHTTMYLTTGLSSFLAYSHQWVN